MSEVGSRAEPGAGQGDGPGQAVQEHQEPTDECVVRAEHHGSAGVGNGRDQETPAECTDPAWDLGCAAVGWGEEGEAPDEHADHARPSAGAAVG